MFATECRGYRPFNKFLKYYYIIKNSYALLLQGRSDIWRHEERVTCYYVHCCYDYRKSFEIQ